MWISTSQLDTGMIVDRDVKMNDIMLVRANTPLRSAHIRSLRRWNVTRVSIVAPEGMQIVDEEESSDTLEKQLSNRRYIKEKSRIDGLFRNMEKDKQMLLIKQCILTHLEDGLRSE